MIEELWHQLIDFTAQFVIPDWGELINLMPVFLAVLAGLWLARTVLRLATAGPTRRGKSRMTPVAPEGLHMPGPTYAPVFAALGLGVLLFGIVLGGEWIVVGVIALALSLLYWGREGLREYDHLVHVERLPAVIHPGPPPGVHLPGPTFRPVLGALAMGVLFFGLVFGGWLLLAGVLFLAAALLGWLADARGEYAKTVEADSTGHLENIPAPRYPTRLLGAFSVIVVFAVLLQAGIIPPRETVPAVGEGSPAPSGEAPGPAGPSIVARDIKYSTHALEVAAGAAFEVAFTNEDPAAVEHDVDLRSDSGTVLLDHPTIKGGESTTYAFDALEAGSYVLICSVHPFADMTATLTVK
ncbi:MAG: cupredoxin domain-containing protein [Chloroflexota bacterium]